MTTGVRTRGGAKRKVAEVVEKEQEAGTIPFKCSDWCGISINLCFVAEFDRIFFFSGGFKLPPDPGSSNERFAVSVAGGKKSRSQMNNLQFAPGIETTAEMALNRAASVHGATSIDWLVHLLLARVIGSLW